MSMRLWVAAQSRPIVSERGASLVEYALLLALIAVVAIIAITAVGTDVTANFQEIADEL